MSHKQNWPKQSHRCASIHLVLELSSSELFNLENPSQGYVITPAIGGKVERFKYTQVVFLEQIR